MSDDPALLRRRDRRHGGTMTTGALQGLILSIVLLTAFAISKYVQHRRKHR